VILLAKADRRSGSLDFQPLGGEQFLAQVPADVRGTLPDSLVLVSEGRTLVRSAAVLEALRGMGPAWRAVARLARLVPEALRDRAYDRIARSRNAIARCVRRPT
jgi:predicted DCC family thiol-disulfide oxidoreductase YuxK